MVSGEFKRDERGFWTAYIDKGEGVRVRYPLSVPFTATEAQAHFAYQCLVARLERLLP